MNLYLITSDTNDTFSVTISGLSFLKALLKIQYKILISNQVNNIQYYYFRAIVAISGLLSEGCSNNNVPF